MEPGMNKNNLSTSSFKENIKFLLKLFLFLGMVIAFFFHVMPQYENLYTASLLDKTERLKSVDGPKIVLLGNSNLTFGMDSEQLESEIGMPVVNMGLHGGAGNAFHEEMAKLHVTEGDIYIICHTDYADDGSLPDEVLIWTVIENHFELWELLRPCDIYPMIERYPVYLKKCLGLYSLEQGNEDPGGAYARSSFNEYGDVAVERKEHYYTFENSVVPPAVGDITVNRINELNRWLNERGATLLVAAYPIGKGELTASEDAFEAFQEELEEALDCPVISQYTDYMFDYQYFYDTDYHLTDEGVALRTKQLIKDIQNWQAGF